MLKKDSLTILIVTYGDRRDSLAKTISAATSAFKNVLKKLIIVQNGIEYDMNDFLAQSDLPEVETKVVLNEVNEGSSGGFGKGVATFIDDSEHDDDYLLILDDDNYIPESTGVNLSKIDFDEYKKLYGDFVLSLYRPSHDQDSQKFVKDWDFDKEYFYNTVNFFSFTHKFSKAKHMKKRKLKENSEMVMAPYSGLLIPKYILAKTEPIYKDYFLYGDDSRFTAQMTFNGVTIIVREDLVSKDLELSWYQSDTKNAAPKSAVQLFIESNKENQMRPMYQIRNEIYSSKTVFKRNGLIYSLNMLIYCLAPMIFFVKFDRRKFNNYKRFLKVVNDGRKGKLGKTY